uniref:Uncharacterized protein n=1 Tax=Arundo donax TaxID=35708 RepID=A0A0A9E7Y1_ARUDO
MAMFMVSAFRCAEQWRHNTGKFGSPCLHKYNQMCMGMFYLV